MALWILPTKISEIGLVLPSLLLIWTAGTMMLVPYLHVLQLESYQLRGYWHIFGAHKGDKHLLSRLIMPISGVLGYFLGQMLFGFVSWYIAGLSGTAILMMVVALIYHRIRKSKVAKKPLVYTARVKRLIAFIQLPPTILFIVICFIGWPTIALLAIFLLIVWADVWVCLAALLAMPVERALQNRFKKQAAEKLSSFTGLKIVGITGSYGKTSTKFILQGILNEKYRVLATPHSYNTPMGICKAIGELLDETHEVFICEMGARHKGDIQEICAFVQPNYSVITSVGPQHLETFGSVDTVAKTKYEIVEGMQAGGASFFPADNGFGTMLYEKTSQPKFLCGLLGDAPQLHAYATDIEVGSWGSRFTLCIDGQSKQAQTVLLGKHNVRNIVTASCVAHALGLNLDEIVAGIAGITPVEHRLQLISRDNGVVVIDDAFNASPAGTRAALEVLSGFEGRKIIVTPGMVELGEIEEKENFEFGKNMASVADIVYLVGNTRRTKAMQEGLKSANFPAENRFRFDAFSLASEALQQILRQGDIVLFENDLPDHLEG